ncbi:hypothetical protein PIB30_030962 [Stylosanthes scabra]|uniref:Uncharacterized protein n=1 Tax=Stylosanthes scabra TaxID=79078 RepID=A0ABU6SCJ7_9FABA|nr:hypothetical protein [Stylosanthes scabra]
MWHPASNDVILDPELSVEEFRSIAIPSWNNTSSIIPLQTSSYAPFFVSLMSDPHQHQQLVQENQHHILLPPIDYSSPKPIVKDAIAAVAPPPPPLEPDIRISKKEFLKAVLDNPPVIFSNSATKLGPRVVQLGILRGVRRQLVSLSSSVYSIGIMEVEIQGQNHTCLCTRSDPSSSKIVMTWILLILCNLVVCMEGKTTMLDAYGWGVLWFVEGERVGLENDSGELCGDAICAESQEPEV